MTETTLEGIVERITFYNEENGWTVVDMKKDWKVIYPFRTEQAKP